MTAGTVRVFVNGEAVDVAAGATALDAVQAWRRDAADEVRAGARVITDSRGLPAPGDAVVQAGSIFRLVSRRERSDVDDAVSDRS